MTRIVLPAWRSRQCRKVVFAMFLLVAGTLVPVVADDSFQLAPAESVGMSSETLQRISTFIQGYIDTDQLAGAVTLVPRRGKIVHYEAQDWRCKQEKVPMSQ